jgi:D-xylose 1-dehydrogenase (NADP+, D-xylono-1,5-lactone-forming)
MDTLRWGILSTANIGKKVVTPAIQACDKCEVVAVASRDEERARIYAEALAIPNHYSSYEALLEDDTIDAIYNPLPNSFHLEWTLKALEAGKHVLCEKPLGLTAQECLTMDEAAKRANRVLMEAFMYRFHPRIEFVQDLLKSKTIGNIRLVRSQFSFKVTDPNNIRLQAELGGGALMDVGCYCVNISRTLFQREPVRAQAFARWNPSGVDTELVGSLEFADHGFAQFYCGLDTTRTEGVEIISEKGSLKFDSAFIPGLSDSSVEIVEAGQKYQQTVGGLNQYQVMVQHFADCVLGGKSLRYTALEGARNMAVIEALYASAHADGIPRPVQKLENF